MNSKTAQKLLFLPENISDYEEKNKLQYLSDFFLGKLENTDGAEAIDFVGEDVMKTIRDCGLEILKGNTLKDDSCKKFAKFLVYDIPGDGLRFAAVLSEYIFSNQGPLVIETYKALKNKKNSKNFDKPKIFPEVQISCDDPDSFRDEIKYLQNFLEKEKIVTCFFIQNFDKAGQGIYDELKLFPIQDKSELVNGAMNTISGQDAYEILNLWNRLNECLNFKSFVKSLVNFLNPAFSKNLIYLTDDTENLGQISKILPISDYEKTLIVKKKIDPPSESSILLLDGNGVVLAEEKMEEEIGSVMCSYALKIIFPNLSK